ncbi:MAG: ribonuclease E/G [Alphaproteobacteria bacterium]
MAKRMLIDATHAEEVRLALVDGSRLDDYDFEIDGRRPLKGNIYLAKVTRVEPSLQAAFVEYGGNRHGFLPFSEIHSDYYKIPTADRIAFEKAQKAADKAATEATQKREEEAERRAALKTELEERIANGEDVDEDELEELGGDDAEEVAEVPRPQMRDFKIQEVIRRNQIMLIQVSKEERGQKGAALTTYLSLAGRYCVLMPNSPRGGGISRKISNPADRKRLKQTLSSLKTLPGMSVILRTAGLNRTKPEIRRDFEYLSRLWSNIRDLTMTSHAPALIYEEGDLIKRTIRDIYNKDFEEVLVSGDDASRQTKDFMRLLMPSHARKVQKYTDDKIPLFYRYQVEPQIDAIHKPVVQLKSGGYLVINPTEALVSIDVNSGRATRERHIEETAYNTNMEAAEEVARQLRLRDLAGLVVIDFIDMEDNGNNKKVERKLKDSLRRDRARIQVGRISQFGLLEMSRQRLRPSIMESSYEACPHCSGTGHLRSVDGSALHVLRALDEEGMRRRTAALTVHIPTDVAMYLLNSKRRELSDMEERWQFEVSIDRDDHLVRPDFRIERTLTRTEEEAAAAAEKAAAKANTAVPVLAGDTLDEQEQAEDKAETSQEQSQEQSKDEQKDEKPKRRRRRRGRGRRGNDNQSEDQSDQQAAADSDTAEDQSDAKADTKAGDEDEAETKPRRRRRRRGGRGRRRRGQDADTKADAETGEAEESSGDQSDSSSGGQQPKKAEASEDSKDEADKGEAKADTTSEDADSEDKPKRRRRGRRGGRRRSSRKVVQTDYAAQSDDSKYSADNKADVKADSKAEAKPAEKPAEEKADAKPKGKSEDKPEETAKEKPKRKRAPRKKAADESKVLETETASAGKAEAGSTNSAETSKSDPTGPKVRQTRRRTRTRRSTRPVPGMGKGDDSSSDGAGGSGSDAPSGTGSGKATAAAVAASATATAAKAEPEVKATPAESYAEKEAPPLVEPKLEAKAPADEVSDIEAEADAAADRRALDDISDDEALDEIWASTATHRSEAADLPGPAVDADDDPVETEAKTDPDLTDPPLTAEVDEEVTTEAEDDFDDELAAEDDPDAAMFDPFGNPPVRSDAEMEIEVDDTFADEVEEDPSLMADAPADDAEDDIADWAPTDPAELELASSSDEEDSGDRKKGWWQKLMDS